MRFRAERDGVTLEEIYAATAAGHPAGRLGDPAEFGDICAFLCSAQAGYLTGQNILFDGGNYRGLL
jgi:3-oxoacyl-[acyl-carrier protein] reductase